MAKVLESRDLEQVSGKTYEKGYYEEKGRIELEIYTYVRILHPCYYWFE